MIVVGGDRLAERVGSGVRGLAARVRAGVGRPDRRAAGAEPLRRRALSCRPLVVLGAISYGVYLFHWPVYVVLDEERTNLPSVPLFVAAPRRHVALAVLSFRHLESPVRRARPRRLLVPVGAATACAVVAAAVVLVPSAARPYWMTADAADGGPAVCRPTRRRS